MIKINFGFVRAPKTLKQKYLRSLTYAELRTDFLRRMETPVDYIFTYTGVNLTAKEREELLFELGTKFLKDIKPIIEKKLIERDGPLKCNLTLLKGGKNELG